MISMRRTVLILAAVLAVPSCSITEERDGCLCRLTVELSEAADVHSGEEMKFTLWNDSGELEKEEVFLSEGRRNMLRHIPKGTVELSAVTGLRSGIYEDSRILVPEGQAADSIFAYHSVIDAGGETARDTIRLAKQYSAIDIQMSGWIPGYGISIRGDYCGLSLEGMKPLRGKFSARAQMISDGFFRTFVPRQGDTGLELVLDFEGKHVKVFPVGKIIGKSMDWTKTDLDDFYILIDFALAKIDITIRGWETGSEREVSF